MIDTAELSRRIGVPIFNVQAHRKVGLDALCAAIYNTAGQTQNHSESAPVNHTLLPAPFNDAVERLRPLCHFADNKPWPKFLIERLLLDTSGYLEQEMTKAHPDLKTSLAAERSALQQAACPIPGIEAVVRYRWIGEMLNGAYSREAELPTTPSDRLDRILTHRIWGTLAFLLLMVALFSSIFWIAEPAKNIIEWLLGLGREQVSNWLNDGPLKSLVLNGVFGGVGSVITFLPQIMVLFLFIGILEDCGYLARAAFLMDKLMSKLGLSGKSFIPLLSSHACAIPGIMATRVIENRRDRFTTILIVPLMSCRRACRSMSCLSVRSFRRFISGIFCRCMGWSSLRCIRSVALTVRRRGVAAQKIALQRRNAPVRTGTAAVQSSFSRHCAAADARTRLGVSL